MKVTLPTSLTQNPHKELTKLLEFLARSQSNT